MDYLKLILNPLLALAIIAGAILYYALILLLIVIGAPIFLTYAIAILALSKAGSYRRNHEAAQ